MARQGTPQPEFRHPGLTLCSAPPPQKQAANEAFCIYRQLSSSSHKFARESSAQLAYTWSSKKARESRAWGQHVLGGPGSSSDVVQVWVKVPSPTASASCGGIKPEAEGSREGSSSLAGQWSREQHTSLLSDLLWAPDLPLQLLYQHCTMVIFSSWVWCSHAGFGTPTWEIREEKPSGQQKLSQSHQTFLLPNHTSSPPATDPRKPLTTGPQNCARGMRGLGSRSTLCSTQPGADARDGSWMHPGFSVPRRTQKVSRLTVTRIHSLMSKALADAWMWRKTMKRTNLWREYQPERRANARACSHPLTPHST